MNKFLKLGWHFEISCVNEDGRFVYYVDANLYGDGMASGRGETMKAAVDSCISQIMDERDER